MKLLILLTLMFSCAYSQNQYVQDLSQRSTPIFFEDSLRFNFTEVANFNSSIGSYGSETQMGLLGQYTSNSYDSLSEKTYNIPSFFFVYNNFEGEFLLIGNEHIKNGFYHDNDTEIEANVDRLFVHFLKGNDLSKLSFGLEGDYGTLKTSKDSNSVENNLFSLDAKLGTVIKPGWDSEFLLEFSFGIIKDSVRINDEAIDGDTQFSNYVPDINVGFLKHSKQHRELGFFAWETNKRNALVFNTVENKVESPIETEALYKFGFLGNFSFKSIPLSLSYGLNYNREMRELWNDLALNSKVGGTTFKEYPFSFATNYKISDIDLALDLRYNKVKFSVDKSATKTSYLDLLSPIDDYEFMATVIGRYLDFSNKKGSFAADFLLGIGAGYILKSPYEAGFLELASLNTVDNKVEQQGSSSSDDLLSDKMTKATVTTGIKMTLSKAFVIDGQYSLNLYKDTMVDSEELSEQLFNGNNLLLKVYYLF